MVQPPNHLLFKQSKQALALFLLWHKIETAFCATPVILGRSPSLVVPTLWAINIFN